MEFVSHTCAAASSSCASAARLVFSSPRVSSSVDLRTPVMSVQGAEVESVSERFFYHAARCRISGLLMFDIVTCSYNLQVLWVSWLPCVK